MIMKKFMLGLVVVISMFSTSCNKEKDECLFMLIEVNEGEVWISKRISKNDDDLRRGVISQRLHDDIYYGEIMNRVSQVDNLREQISRQCDNLD